MREIYSTNLIQCHSDHKTKDRIHKIKYVNDIIQDLEHYGPAGLIHIVVLSSIIKRPIKIWNANGSLNKIIGKRKMGHPVDIEYHAIDSEEVGHWTLRGSKDPGVTDLNSCLFSVIGSQIEQNPLKLRKWTLLKLKKNFQNLVKWVDKIKLKTNDKMIFMIGGARYVGTSPNDAGEILNRSDNEYCHEPPCVKVKGHPRGHASGSPSDCRLTVEKYSIKQLKSGFLSRADQDYVTHLALKTKTALNAMERLNNGSMEEAIKISAEDLKKVVCSKNDLPLGKLWNKGKEQENSEKSIKTVVLVLRHHIEEFDNAEADVFIHTCYPMIEEPKIKKTKEKEIKKCYEKRRRSQLNQIY